MERPETFMGKKIVDRELADYAVDLQREHMRLTQAFNNQKMQIIKMERQLGEAIHGLDRAITRNHRLWVALAIVSGLLAGTLFFPL